MLSSIVVGTLDWYFHSKQRNFYDVLDLCSFQSKIWYFYLSVPSNLRSNIIPPSHKCFHCRRWVHRFLACIGPLAWYSLQYDTGSILSLWGLLSQKHHSLQYSITFQERHQILEEMGISVQDSGIGVKEGRYYLVNLNADPSLNELLVYYLKVTCFW